MVNVLHISYILLVMLSEVEACSFRSYPSPPLRVTIPDNCQLSIATVHLRKQI